MNKNCLTKTKISALLWKITLKYSWTENQFHKFSYLTSRVALNFNSIIISSSKNFILSFQKKTIRTPKNSFRVKSLNYMKPLRIAFKKTIINWVSLTFKYVIYSILKLSKKVDYQKYWNIVVKVLKNYSNNLPYNLTELSKKSLNETSKMIREKT